MILSAKIKEIVLDAEDHCAHAAFTVKFDNFALL